MSKEKMPDWMPEIYQNSGFTVYQGPNNQRLASSWGQTSNMTQKPDDNWHFTDGTARGERGQQSGLKHRMATMSRENDEEQYETTMGTEAMPGRGSGSPTSGIAHLFSVYSDKSSISGVPFIKNTKYMSVRAVWSILLFIACIAMTAHLTMLFKTFFSFTTQTKLELNFSSLEFPAVTICNTNAIRKSAISLASLPLQNLVREVDPERLQEEVDSWTPEEDEYLDEQDHKDHSESDSSRRKRDAVESGTRPTNGFLDNWNFNESYYEEDYYDNHTYDGTVSNLYGDSWYEESQPSTFDQVEEEFSYLYSLENGTTRFKMGHRIQDMLVQCSFSGRRCNARNFSLVESATYGNCYTLQYKKFLVKESGPRQGMEIIINLETDEYVPGITNSQGLQVVVHDQKTVPFPDDDGFGVSAGTNTFIGLRQIDISRLDAPYGKCKSIEDFFKKYRKRYTRQTCQKLCLQEIIRSRCECYDGTNMLLNNMLTIPPTLSVCSTLDQRRCVSIESYAFLDNASDCGCTNACSEKKFVKSISTRQWPNYAFGKVIAQTLCRTNTNLCSLQNKSDIELQKEFVKLTLFFEDLNHEIVEEQAAYELFQFASDIGGTIGLWIGLSVLSICEIFHLLFAAARYLCCGNWQHN